MINKGIDGEEVEKMSFKDTLIKHFRYKSGNTVSHIRNSFYDRFCCGCGNKENIKITEDSYCNCVYHIEFEGIEVACYNQDGKPSYYYGKDSFGIPIENAYDLGKWICLLLKK